jgi:hypothetical protein
MNYLRLFLAAIGGFVAYFVIGGLAFVSIPSLKTEFLKFPNVYRDHDGQISHMPVAMAAIFVAILVLSVLYALLYQGGSGLVEGARFGVLIGLFVVCAFVLHNYVNLNIGRRLTLEQALAYFVEWTVTCIVIGLIYRPLPPH